MNARPVLSALYCPASILALACLAAPACNRSDDGPLGEVEQHVIPWQPPIEEARIFDLPPDDPRQYDGTLCSVGGPPLISGDAYLAKYGCTANSRAPLGFYWNPNIGDFECRGAYLYRSEFEDELAATACVTITDLAPLSCSTTPQDFCGTTSSSSTQNGNTEDSLSSEKKICASTKAFGRITVAVGMETKATAKAGLELFGSGCELANSIYGKVEVQGGIQTEAGGTQCVTQQRKLSVKCGGQTWNAGQLSCNSFWEHKDSLPAKYVTKYQWPVYELCSLEIDGRYYGWSKKQISTEWVESTELAFRQGKDVYEQCTGCQPPSDATQYSNPPNCRTQRPDGTWAARNADQYGHLISPHALVAANRCAYQCLSDADCDSSGNGCYTCQNHACGMNPAKINAVECGGSGGGSGSGGGGSGSGSGGY